MTWGYLKKNGVKTTRMGFRRPFTDEQQCLSGTGHSKNKGSTKYGEGGGGVPNILLIRQHRKREDPVGEKEGFDPRMGNRLRSCCNTKAI